MNIITLCNRVIEWSFYALFFLVPLAFVGSTSELFEFNKMWVAFGLTVVIAVAWFTKMIIEKQFRILKTPVDIFLLLFLASQLISTLISLDNRVSLWGYYSRFNGGFLSIFSYVFLFFAFVNHFSSKQTVRLLLVTLLSGLLVGLWGLPSHFGYDPTCYIFRGTLDVSCWTDAFRPTIRIFSTLGQPAWLAAYLAVLIPVSMAMFLRYFIPTANPQKYRVLSMEYLMNKRTILYTAYFILIALFYACLLYANTRAGFAGFWLANIVFWVVLLFKKFFPVKQFLILLLVLNSQLFILNFLIGTPYPQLNPVTLGSLRQQATTQPTNPPAGGPTPNQTKQTPTQPATEPNITNSGTIRLHVWKGAIDAWKANPIFGTGVETFAYAYYQNRPVGHNLTSEWDYLYNKAHNEFLNYLTTSGVFGYGTYLLFLYAFMMVVFAIPLTLPLILLVLILGPIGIFGIIGVRAYKTRQFQFLENQNAYTDILIVALFSGWLSILVTNALGFSVVIMNLFLFLIPAFVFVLADLVQEKAAWTYPKEHTKSSHISGMQWTGITVLILLGVYLLYGLWNFWRADKSYALGYNLARNGEYQAAYNPLKDAHQMRPDEPVFTDELSAVSSQVAYMFFQQQDATSAAEFAQQAIDLNNEVLNGHPNSLVFWKTRIRIFYTLGQVDARYLNYALQSAEQAAKLAPTDAKVSYNLGVLYGQTGNTKKGIEVLKETIRLKPDYADAYYAIGLFYHDLAVDENGKIVDQAMQEAAVKSMKYILENLDPQNEAVKQALEDWSGG